MKFKIALYLFAATLLSSCQKDLLVQDGAVQTQPQVDESKYFTPSAAYLASLDAYARKPESSLRGADCNWTEIPTGSVDALDKAIAAACEGGVIYLKSGVHIENKAITISKSIKLIGEAGTILRFKSAVSPLDTVTGSLALKPALHFLNAPRSLVQGIDIQPLASAGATALLFENSNESSVMRCKITNFQWSIWVEKSDKMVMMRNTITATDKWQTGEASEAEGICIANGKSVYVADNEINNALFGIWACDRWGTCERNNTYGNYLGIILCNVPAGFYKFPDGQFKGSLIPGNNWKTRNNTSTDNLNVGILVIDGANGNIVENNNLARNGDYDIELTTDSYRFGFLTPMSYNNTVNAGSFTNIRIKDCGRNNQITGGIRINTTTNPCN
jgi:nitrous oxidase accessory protein NosD